MFKNKPPSKPSSSPQPPEVSLNKSLGLKDARNKTLATVSSISTRDAAGQDAFGRRASPILHEKKPTGINQHVSPNCSRKTASSGGSKPCPLTRILRPPQEVRPFPKIGALDNSASQFSQRNTMSGERPFAKQPSLASENIDPTKVSSQSGKAEKLSAAPLPNMSKPLLPFELPAVEPLASPEKGESMKQPRNDDKRQKGTMHAGPKAKTFAVRGAKLAAFPTLSPLSSPARPADEKAKNTTKAKDEPRQKRRAATAFGAHDNSIKSCLESDMQHGPRPFPMSTQVLNSISSLASSAMAGLSTFDQSYFDGSDNEHGRKRTKLQKEVDSIEPISLTGPAYNHDVDSLVLSPTIDPKTLCPYCDAPLPSAPTTLLVRLLQATAQRSRPDPRPTNPLGRKAPFTVFIAVCQRHRFESEILPEAERRKWPKKIDWASLGNRITKMKSTLSALIYDGGFDSGFGDSSLDHKDKRSERRPGPRSKCVFWKEVMDEVKKKGSKVAAGIRCQFDNFEKAQPGYYGEMGSAIIHQILYDLFPPSSIDGNLVSPLTPNEFIQRIVIPEVGIRLIMEDRGLEGDAGVESAVQILRESASYGVAMFPEDGADGEGGGEARRGNGAGEENTGISVADIIVMNRAMKRRKELEEEEEDGDGGGDGGLTDVRLMDGSNMVAKVKRKDADRLPARPKPRPRRRHASVCLSSEGDPTPWKLQPTTT